MALQIEVGSCYTLLVYCNRYWSLMVLVWLSSVSGQSVFPPQVQELQGPGWQVHSRVELPVDAGWQAAGSPVPYIEDRSASLLGTAIGRVGHYLELTKADGSVEWVWASYQMPEGRTAQDLLVPHAVSNPIVRREKVDGLTVESNVSSVETVTMADGGNVEMWASDYGPGDDGLYIPSADHYTARFDTRDAPLMTQLRGSFQIHHFSRFRTVLAWNGWARADGVADDVGIGNGPYETGSDWTGRANAGAYTSRRLITCVRVGGPRLVFEKWPQHWQVVMRAPGTQQGTVRVKGRETTGGWTHALLRATRNGQAWQSEQLLPLSYGADGSAPLDLSVSITAELADYAVYLSFRRPGEADWLATGAEHLCAGDAILVYGQSNAAAGPQGGGSAFELTSPWVRTFGVQSSAAGPTREALYWMTAIVDEWPFRYGGIGRFGGVAAGHLIRKTGIPLAVINGAEGGRPLWALVKDRAAPFNLDEFHRIYNRQYYRTSLGGLNDGVRAVYFFQGEADTNTNPSAYLASFQALRQDLKTDYPNLERIYVHQTLGYGFPPSLGIRETQRQWGRLFPDVSVSTANGRRLVDGVHYRLEDGHAVMGQQLAWLTHRDLYGGPDLEDIEAPDVTGAQWSGSSGKVLRLPWKKPVQSLQVQAGAESDFVIEGSNAKVAQVTWDNGALYLHLDRVPYGVQAVVYRSRQYGPGWILNGRQIGLMTFREAIQGRLPSVTIELPVAGRSEIVGEQILLSAAGSGGGAAVVGMELWVDGQLVAGGPAVAVSSLSTQWISEVSGSHEFIARVTNADGFTVSAARSFLLRPLDGPVGLHPRIEGWWSGWSGLSVSGSQATWADLGGRSRVVAAPSGIATQVEVGSIGVAPALVLPGGGTGPVVHSSQSWPASVWSLSLFHQPSCLGVGRWIGGGSPSARVWDVMMTASGQLQVIVQGQVILQSHRSLTLDPQSVQLTYDGSSLKLFLDGILETQGTLAMNWDGTWTIDSAYCGKVSEIGLWRSVLTADELLRLHQANKALTGTAVLTYAQWVSATLGHATVGGFASGDPHADPDGDGVVNLGEYLVGLPPMLPSAGNTDLFSADFTAFPNFTLRTHRLTTRPGASFSFQSSTGLTAESWQDVTGGLASSQGVREVWEWSPPHDLSVVHRFYRLKLSLNP